MAIVDFNKEVEKLRAEYERARKDGKHVLEDFARSANAQIELLYAMQKDVDPKAFAAFQQMANSLAWETGFPASAVNHFSGHNLWTNWRVNADGSLVFSLENGGVSCSDAVKNKIKADFVKETKEKWDDSFFKSDPPCIKIPAAKAGKWRAHLTGATTQAVKDNGGANTSASSLDIFGDVVADPLFKILTGYQKKFLSSGKSPEDMLDDFCTMSLLLPLEYLNAVAEALNKWLKTWANQPVEAEKRKAERTPVPPPKTPDGSPGTPPPVDSGPTVGDVLDGYLLARQGEQLRSELLEELSQMKDPKSQSLYDLLKSCKTETGRTELSEQQKILEAQLKQMRPFIIKHARDNKNSKIDDLLKTMPNGDKILDDLNKKIEAIKNGRAPNDSKIEEKTAPDLEQLYSKLQGDTPQKKWIAFTQWYESSKDLQIRNNALVCAVHKIMGQFGLSDADRQKALHDLMHGDTIWTPEDLTAVQQMADQLYHDKKIDKPLSYVPIKPYGQKADEGEVTVSRVADRSTEAIKKALAKRKKEGGALPDGMVNTKDTTRNADITEMIDPKSESITLRVEKEGESPYFVTYCDKQKKAIVVTKTMRAGKEVEEKHVIDFEKGTVPPQLQALCTQLSLHYSAIKEHNNPLEKGRDLRDTFSALTDETSKIKDARDLLGEVR